MSRGTGNVSMVTYSRVPKDLIIRPNWTFEGERLEALQPNGSNYKSIITQTHKHNAQTRKHPHHTHTQTQHD